MHERFVHDPIHGLISFDDKTWNIIDTLHFQRLRDIHQLDVSYLIYPGARHSRFEHSLGVGFLAEAFIRSLKQKQPELELRHEDVEAVKLAGLCHDLGHGPFSHLFDSLFIPKVRPNISWSHEVASELLVEDLIDKYAVDVSRSQINLIKDLIKGDVSDMERKFLFEIVANKRNSFDVDKFDYINRDSYYIGFKDSFNYDRAFQQARVINDQICYHKKEVFNIWELYQKRFSLFKRVYSHHTAEAIQLMIVDALVSCDSIMNFSKSIDSVEDYISFNDSVLSEISRSKNPGLKEAQDILKRIKYRDLYKLVYETIITIDDFCMEDLKKNVASMFDISDFEFVFFSINYGFKDRNPLEKFQFYDHSDINSTFNPNSLESFSMQVDFLPERFEEHIFRVFCKSGNAKISKELQCFIQEYFSEKRA